MAIAWRLDCSSSYGDIASHYSALRQAWRREHWV